jgi:hypothetical protein
LPSDLFASDRWPSPSPEDVVRQRVRARARYLVRRRLLPVAAVVLLGSAAVIQGFPGTDSASQVHVTDNRRVDDGAVVDSGAPAAGETSPQTGGTGSARPPQRGSARGGAAGGPESGSPLPSGSAPDGGGPPLVLDREGDGMPSSCSEMGTECVQGGLNGVDGWDSQPALDWISGDVAGRRGRLTATLRLLDLGRPLDSEQVTEAKYGIDITVGSVVLGWAVMRDVRSGAVTVQATMGGRAVALASQQWVVDVAHSLITVSADYAELNAMGGTRVFQPGARATPTFTTYSISRPETPNVSGQASAQTAWDQMEPGQRGKWAQLGS